MPDQYHHSVHEINESTLPIYAAVTSVLGQIATTCPFFATAQAQCNGYDPGRSE